MLRALLPATGLALFLPTMLLTGCGKDKATPAAEPTRSAASEPATGSPDGSPDAKPPTAAPDGAEAPPLAIGADEVYVRVSRLNGGLGARGPGGKARRYREPILVLRGDGIALWSTDPKGGGPMLTGKVDADAVAAWATKIYNAGILTDAAMRSHVGPDATSIELDIKIADQALKIVSWHEMVDPTKVIALENGLVGLDGRDPAKLMAKESPEYQRFVRNWARLRSDLQSLLPEASTPLPEGTDLSRFD